MNGPGGFDWAALMRAGLQGLGLSPAEFWRLGPTEFLLMLGEAGAGGPMRRDAFEALSARFPETTAASSEGDTEWQ
ncbi:phage tail assembly chaperone [Roseibacterium sp. SDUM158017]|uniref:rcc01693 family protein n=1 Tax=Roseicyclus salinarum TaxID=3036773 RepID=UPI0024151B48|nr:rcc01693 family protein [Roseibacterium sp. SDUM158017]MDG4649806.1 phage tail assembly chaperone [Roseibacterium sp. SDUM158017]